MLLPPCPGLCPSTGSSGISSHCACAKCSLRIAVSSRGTGLGSTVWHSTAWHSMLPSCLGDLPTPLGVTQSIPGTWGGLGANGAPSISSQHLADRQILLPPGPGATLCPGWWLAFTHRGEGTDKLRHLCRVSLSSPGRISQGTTSTLLLSSAHGLPR